jgi:pimeloyl-ACP methyl ester carboxylesterase
VDDIVVKVLSELVPGGVRRGDLRRGSRALRWVEAGSGGPAVVFDAALGEPGSLAWAAVLPAVAEHTRVIAYDRAGVGASDPVWPLTVEGEVADLAALLSQAGQGRCVLVGHSWGGLLAQLVAFSHPDLVAGLVLVDPAHEETTAAVPWPLRAAVSAPGHVALLLHWLGLAGRMVRGTFRPFARRLTSDPQLQALILDAYAFCYSKRTQVRPGTSSDPASALSAPHRPQGGGALTCGPFLLRRLRPKVLPGQSGRPPAGRYRLPGHARRRRSALVHLGAGAVTQPSARYLYCARR